MSENIEIRIVVDPSLVKYFEEGMRERHINRCAKEEMCEFLAMNLNDSIYPMASKQTNDHEIHLSYRPKAYANPIF